MPERIQSRLVQADIQHALQNAGFSEASAQSEARAMLLQTRPRTIRIIPEKKPFSGNFAGIMPNYPFG